MYHPECPECCSDDIEYREVDAYEAYGERGPSGYLISRIDIRCRDCGHSDSFHLEEIEELIKRAWSEGIYL